MISSPPVSGALGVIGKAAGFAKKNNTIPVI
jgi:hypothetical protein